MNSDLNQFGRSKEMAKSILTPLNQVHCLYGEESFC